ncbi:MAG: hypothetical protein ACPGRZ_05445 [Alphaproteobacteria bacterium]
MYEKDFKLLFRIVSDFEHFLAGAHLINRQPAEDHTILPKKNRSRTGAFSRDLFAGAYPSTQSIFAILFLVLTLYSISRLGFRSKPQIV